MNGSKPTRTVIGLVLLAVLCTVALGLQERRSTPLVADSPTSPVDADPRPLFPLRDQPPQEASRALLLQEIGTRAFWLSPWPWIVVGLVGFGLLAWALTWGVRRLERD